MMVNICLMMVNGLLNGFPWPWGGPKLDGFKWKIPSFEMDEVADGNHME